MLTRREFLNASWKTAFGALALALRSPFPPGKTPDADPVKENPFLKLRPYVSSNAESVIIAQPGDGVIDRVISPPPYIQGLLDRKLKVTELPIMTLPGGKSDGGRQCLLTYDDGTTDVRVETLKVGTVDGLSMDINNPQDTILADDQFADTSSLRAVKDMRTGALFVLQGNTILRTVSPSVGAEDEEKYQVHVARHALGNGKSDFVRSVTLLAGGQYVSQSPTRNSTVII
ncbi:hypothetical protein HZC27_05820 [Candidatus Roizmanbacteria bacterium]|nr:hypothetical protein [Candidatus Roizmanbacteria bacterium]